MKRIGVPFELAIVASEIGSYKPGHAHWARFFEETGAARETPCARRASYFHDVVPASELGLRTIWINRSAKSASRPRRASSPISPASPKRWMTSSPPEGFRVRPATVEDAPAINELVIAVDTAVQGWSDSTELEILGWWR